MEREAPSSERVDLPVPEQNQRRKAHRYRRPVPPGWNEWTRYPSWLPSAPWKIEGDPDEVPGDGKHWESARKLVEDFDAATVAGWKDEVQTQLLVVCLFYLRSSTLMCNFPLGEFARCGDGRFHY